MTNTDEQGNKIAQTRQSKKLFAKNLRQKRILASYEIPKESRNPVFCGVCGFRVRGKNHLEGEHHQKVERELNSGTI